MGKLDSRWVMACTKDPVTTKQLKQGVLYIAFPNTYTTTADVKSYLVPTNKLPCWFQARIVAVGLQAQEQLTGIGVWSVDGYKSVKVSHDEVLEILQSMDIQPSFTMASNIRRIENDARS